jgi:tetratricopeptide (TPR) repeat protein
MEYIEGRDLSSRLREGRPPIEESIEIMRQVCAALHAAHSENVIHRDLKPQNILIDVRGKVVVMDFGLARSIEMPGMTQTGTVLGTPAYMSPEQAKGAYVDARSDLFAFGIMFYELLTGTVPFAADTMLGSLLKRTQEPPEPAIQLDPAIPQTLSDLVQKCLAIDPAMRYQSATEIVADLSLIAEGAQVSVTASTLSLPVSPHVMPRARRIRRNLILIGLGVALLVIASASVFFSSRFMKVPVGKRVPTTVLVADFTNQTGNTIFDGTLEPIFNLALEGASLISSFNRGTARQAARKLPHPTDKLDEQSVRLVAVSLGVNTVVSGTISQRGGGYKVTVEAMDAVTGNAIGSAEINAPTKESLLLAMPKLAAPIRKALGDATPESAQLTAMRGTFAAASLEVVHQYGIAMEQQFAGKWEDALQSFSKAAALDPNFGRAYFGMAAASRALGRNQQAQDYLKLAMAHVDRMTERERYRTRVLYFAMAGDPRKCVEEYSALVSQYPSDNVGHNNLGSCYVQLRNYPKALDEARRAVEISPTAMQRMNLSLYLSLGGDFPAAERKAREVLERTRRTRKDTSRWHTRNWGWVSWRKPWNPSGSWRR